MLLCEIYENYVTAQININDVDAMYNKEALTFKKNQEEYYKKYFVASDIPPIFSKTRPDENKWTTKPNGVKMPSPGGIENLRIVKDLEKNGKNPRNNV